MSNFESKEQYLQFISAWKLATNSDKTKSKRLVCDHVQQNWNQRYTKEEQEAMKAKGYTKVGDWGFTIPNGGHYKEHGQMEASHYVFRNMMLGKDPKRGFSPKSKRKLQYGETEWTGFSTATYELEFAVNDAKRYVDEIGAGKKPTYGHRARNFLKPFEGEIAIADLLKIKVHR